MACICQYFVAPKGKQTANGSSAVQSYGSDFNVVHTDGAITDSKESQPGSNQSVCATELAAAKAEIWVLKKNLNDSQISIENLENLVHTIIAKQNELLSEMYELKRQNFDLQDECRMQRDYQTMERNAMIRELYDIKMLLNDRTKLLEETVVKNSELTTSLQDANEKIYLMGMKFLKMKSSRSKHSNNSSQISLAASERSI